MDHGQQAQMLLQIQQLQFVTAELNLYLDTHPQDQKALALFNQIHHELMQSVRSYEQIYGPLLGFGYSPATHQHWQWAQGPWPWEL